MSIHQQAMLVDITFGLPKQTVKLETVSRQVEEQAHAETGVVRSSGYYFRKREGNKVLNGLRELSQFQSSWGNELKYYARYPFAGGFKLLPATLLSKFMETNQRFVSAELEVWNHWAQNEYPKWASSAPQRMGALYNAADFPSLDQCRDAFVCDVTVLPMAPVDQWRHITAIAPDVAAVMQEREEEAIRRVTKESHAQLWKDIMAPLKNVVEQLSKDKARIHETLIENVTSIAALVPAYNAVIQDPQLEELAAQVQQTLAKITAEDLRKDASIREATMKTASKLVDIFDPYARSFELDEEETPASEPAQEPADTAPSGDLP